MDLLDHFSEYCHVIKKNSNQIQTSAEETSVPIDPSSEESPPIQNTSESGSTEEELPIEKPVAL